VCSLFVSVGDPTSGEVVRGEFNLDAVARQDSDVMHAHLSGDVGQHLVAIFKLDFEHCIRERFNNRSFKHDRVFLWLRQLVLLRTKYTLDVDQLTYAWRHKAEERY
jgi:hypothetical protein